MAVLSTQDRADVTKEFSANVSARRDALDLLQPDLQAAVDAIDSWIEANAAAFNQSIPQPARTNLTLKMKNEIFELVVTRRYNLTP